jgi:hypothetical protein
MKVSCTSAAEFILHLNWVERRPHLQRWRFRLLPMSTTTHPAPPVCLQPKQGCGILFFPSELVPKRWVARTKQAVRTVASNMGLKLSRQHTIVGENSTVSRTFGNYREQYRGKTTRVSRFGKELQTFIAQKQHGVANMR